VSFIFRIHFISFLVWSFNLLHLLSECYAYHCGWAPLRPSDPNFRQTWKPGSQVFSTKVKWSSSWSTFVFSVAMWSTFVFSVAVLCTFLLTDRCIRLFVFLFQEIN
jgi:hypothetical protein